MKFAFLIIAMLPALFSDAQCLSGNCENGEGTSLFSKTIIYTGSFKNGLPDGKGSFRNADFTIYTGEVKHGLYNGKGTLYYVNGDVFIGNFVNGLRTGPGEYRGKFEITKATYKYNGDEYRTIVTDDKNQNGIFTSYNKLDNAVLSNNKVAVFTAEGLKNCSIYDASTGMKTEQLQLYTAYVPDRTRLYLDFGTAYYDTTGNTFYMLEKKHNSEWAYWKYLGKSAAGDAIFWQHSSGDVNRLFTMTSYDRKKNMLYKYEGGEYNIITAVTKDLSKALLGGRIIQLNHPKENAVTLKDYDGDYNASVVFTPSGDSLFYFHANKTDIYSTATGEKIGTVPQLNYGINAPESYSFDPYKLLRTLEFYATLAIVESPFDNTPPLPLIDPEKNYIDYTVYMDKELKIMEERAAFEEKERKAYAKKMTALYGPDWNKETIAPAKNTHSNSPQETKCPFCNGSGVTANYVTGNEIEQDKNGRWYHVSLAKTSTCPVCHGTGYVKR